MLGFFPLGAGPLGDDAIDAAAGGVTGDLAATLANATLAADGTLTAGLSGDLSATLDAATLASDGALLGPITGDATIALAPATLTAAADMAAPVTGDLSATLADATLTAFGGPTGADTPRRRRGASEFYYPPRREAEREPVADAPEVAPPVIVPEVRPIVPGAALPVRKPIVARDLRDLGRVLGLDARSLEAARRQAELDEDDEDVLLLL